MAKQKQAKSDSKAEATPLPAQETQVAAPGKPSKPAKKAVAKGMSALEAAALALAETGKAMTPKEMIGVMAARGWWSSPGGKTPHATLYSAIMREVDEKGETSRFRKAAPGRFALSCWPA